MIFIWKILIFLTFINCHFVLLGVQFVCYQKENLKYSPKKMWYIACMVRGLTIDEAIRQMRFVSKKGALFVLEALLEAQEMAVKQHNVEFKSNLWVGKCDNTVHQQLHLK